MGSSPNPGEWNIRLVQSLEDPNFGSIDVYKSEEGKYIMMLKRTFMKDERSQYSKDSGFHELLHAAE
jgi:hypothetical protein